MRTLTAAAIAASSLLLTPAAAAQAPGGSDAPVPYTVTAEGVTLPDGAAFPDGGHVNVRYTVDGVERAAGIHFETLNDQPSGAYVGESFLPWSALTDSTSFCVTWVQVSLYDEHFGEGAQEPVCTDDVPTPSATPTPSSSTVPSATPVPTDASPSTGPTAPEDGAASDDTIADQGAGDGVLAATGSMAVPVALFAALLVAAGAVLVVLGRRTRRG